MTGLFSKFIKEHLHQYVHPIVCAKTHKLAFFEVLSRVTYNGVTYAPREFLADITDIQRYQMTKLVISNIINLQKRYPSLSFSINLTTGDIVEGIDKILEDLAINANSMLDPKRTIIEIVETALLTAPAKEKIVNLKKYGYRFAIDDFGAGYSTINQLNKANQLFEFVKVDGELLKDVEENPDARSTLHMLIHIIKKYDKKVILEFVETKEIMDISIQAVADYLQGFLFGTPAPIESYLERIDLNCSIVPIKEKNELNY